MELIIGNKNYSSWSLRGWLMLKAFELPHQETRLSLFTEDFYNRLELLGVPGKVPVLIDGEIKVWDSLAICEYLNETRLDGRGWPRDLAARAKARSIANEMHSGFMALRSEMPMNCRARRRLVLSDAAQADIARIDTIWSEQRDHYADQGPWLFGQFSIADVMYAPVASRFQTYGIALSDSAGEYRDTVLSHPAMKQWYADAAQEAARIEEEEVGEPVEV